MKLTEAAKDLLLAKTREAKALRYTLALALGFTDQWIVLSAKANKDNGPLTKVKAVEVIHKSTGLDQSQILEESSIEARA